MHIVNSNDIKIRPNIVGSISSVINRTQVVYKTLRFLNDIIMVSFESEHHLKLIDWCLKPLDEANLLISLQKRHFEKLKIDWFGRNFSETGILPLESYTAQF